MSAFRFLLVSVGVFGALAVSYLAAFVAGWSQPIRPIDPLRDIHLVKLRLAEETESPRWLIVGGSSAWFGFESGLLAEAVGQPVVNLGAHADVPLWFQLEQVERLARSGDTVLLAAELVHYWRAGPTTFGASSLGTLAPEAWAKASGRQRWELLGAIPPSHVVARLIAKAAAGEMFEGAPAEELMTNLRARWAGTFTGEVPGYYNYLEIGPQGDFSRVREAEEHRREDYGLSERQEWAPGVGRDLTEVARRLRSRGVDCVFTWPPFERHTGIDFEAPVVRANLNAIRERLGVAGWREVGTVDDAIFDAEDFYDTGFHLTTEGARRRTLRLVGRLRAAAGGG